MMDEQASSKKEESRYSSGTYVPEYSVTKYRYRKDVTSLVALGRKAFSDGEFEAALRYFKAILLIDPANKLAMYFKKKTIYKMKMLELGKQRETEVLQAEESEDPEAHNLVQCGSCKGSGVCQRCAGKGLCPNCSGTGWLDLLGKQCGMCGGSGYCDECNEGRTCPECNGKGAVEPVALSS